MLIKRNKILQAVSKIKKCCPETQKEHNCFKEKKKQFESLKEIVIDETVWLAFFLPDNLGELSENKSKCIKCVGQANYKLKKEALEVLNDQKKLSEISGILNPLSKTSKVVILMFVELIYLLRQNVITEKEIKKNYLFWIETANHFGLWKLRYVLEDILFLKINQKEFDLIKSLLKKEEKHYKKLLIDIGQIIQYKLEKNGIKNFEILNRKKNIYGIYKKMQIKGKSINHITDFFGFRILVEKEEECYKVSDILVDLWPFYSDRYKDYIQFPKSNQYQSIHQTLSCLNGHMVEFQIRTYAMDYIAKFGPASHLTYKERQK